MLSIIARVLGWIGRHAAWLLAAGVFTGLALPALAGLLRPLMIAAIVVALALALTRIDWRDMAAYGRRPRLLAPALAWLLVLSPIAVWLMASALGLPPALVTALTLMAAAPPIMSAAAFALILGLDAALAAVLTTAATLAVPFILPSLALYLFGFDLGIGMVGFTTELIAVIATAFALGLTARKLAKPDWIAAHSRQIDGLAVIALLVFAIAIMDGVTATAMERPGFVLLCIAVAFAANLVLQAAGALAFLTLGRRRALTVGFATGNCNMGIVLAAIAGRADFDIVVFFAVAQLPMYILPALLKPLYGRLLRN